MKKQKIGQYLAIAFSVLFSLPAIGKIMQAEPLVEQLSVNGVGDWTVIIGLGLLVSVVLFALPKTKNIGTLLLSSYFGGAILFHMALSEPFVLQAIILLVVWTIAWLRGLELIQTPRSHL